MSMLTSLASRLTFTLIVFLVILGTQGCTRIALNAMGVDPDKVKITDYPTISEQDYDPVIKSIGALKAQIRGRVAFITPSREQIYEFIENHPISEKAALAYQKEVYNSLGSMRTTEEMRNVVVPSMQNNARVFHQYVLPELVKKRNIFGTVDVFHHGNIFAKEIEKYKIKIFTDLSDNKTASIRIIAYGETVTADGFVMFDGKDIYRNSKEFVEWVEQVIRR